MAKTNKSASKQLQVQRLALREKILDAMTEAKLPPEEVMGIVEMAKLMWWHHEMFSPDAEDLVKDPSLN